MMISSDSRRALFARVDEVTRLSGRFESVFAPPRQAAGRGETELLVLIEGVRAPTASQIGRSLGIARQLVQRAVNALMAEGLLVPDVNPDHKRAAKGRTK